MQPIGLLFTSLLALVSGKIWEVPVPRSLQECYDQVQHADIQTFVGSTYAWFCETAIKKSQMTGPASFDGQKMGYYKQLYDRSIEYAPDLRDFGRRRSNTRRGGFRGRRQAGQARCVRREYRMLSDGERRRFHRAVNALKSDTTVEPNKYDAIALLHTGMAAFTAHGGAGFPGWHRIYILMFETALREVDPQVCLPYWDSSLDAELEDPTLSPIWNNDFFGTSQGAVTEGPFAGWETPEGAQLMRNVGADGDSFTAEAIEDVLSRTSHADILTSSETDPRYDLEFHHAAVHVYCGGTMGQLDTAAFDPIFFLHHSFVDYLWELFRTNLRSQGIDPEVYPVVEDTESRHHGDGQTGFGNMTQADGYSDFLTESYEYEAAPICDRQFPECGSRYLTCFSDIGRCVPIDPDVVIEPQGSRPIPTIPIQTGSGRVIETQENRRTNPRGQEVNNVGDITVVQPNRNLPNTNIQVEVPTHLPRGNINNHNNNLPSGGHSHRPNPFPAWQPSQQITFPNAGTCAKKYKNYGNAVQNNYCCDKSCDSDEWATIPVKIVSVRPPKFRQYNSFPVKNGKVQRNSDIYSPSAYAQTNRYITKKIGQPKTYKRCNGDENIGQVFLTSKGLNYDGYYKEASIVDNRLAVSISMGFINVKRPTRGSRGVTRALLRAHDSCGRVCHPACKDMKTGEYKACSGAVAISNQSPLMYGDTYDQAVMNVFDFAYNNDCPRFKSENFYVTFYCDYHNSFPYASHSHGGSAQPAARPQLKPRKPKPQVVQPVGPANAGGCQITKACHLDVPCVNRRCSKAGIKHVCADSCRAYAVCTYGNYFLRLCPEGHYFDDTLKKCVEGYCRKVKGGPRELENHATQGSRSGYDTRGRITNSYAGSSRNSNRFPQRNSRVTSAQTQRPFYSDLMNRFRAFTSGRGGGSPAAGVPEPEPEPAVERPPRLPSVGGGYAGTYKSFLHRG